MKAYELMFELSHLGRLKALRLLSRKPLRLTDLSRTLDIPTAEISRHLGRLSKVRLITKDGKGRYNLTSFGDIILHELSNIGFLTARNQYFSTHDLSAIPDELRWLGAISKCELVEGTLEIMSMVQDMSVNAERHVHVISDQLMRSMVDINLKKAKEGVDFKLIYSKEVNMDDLYRPKKKVPIEVRLLDETPVGLKSNEKNAGVTLPDKDGKIDFGYALMGNEPEVLEWVESLFDHYWQKAEPAF